MSLLSMTGGSKGSLRSALHIVAAPGIVIRYLVPAEESSFTQPKECACPVAPEVQIPLLYDEF